MSTEFLDTQVINDTSVLTNSDIDVTSLSEAQSDLSAMDNLSQSLENLPQSLFKFNSTKITCGRYNLH